MIHGKKIAVIIPAFNEEDFIVKTVQEIPKEIDEIVCVDDQSKDRTFEVMKSLAKKDKKITVLQTDKNGGIGHGVITGAVTVLDRVDYVSVLPGDNQCDAKLIPRFVERCEREGLDCVKGNRFLNGNDTSKMPQNRKIGNILYSVLTKVVSGYFTIFDSQHGFCAIKTEYLRNGGIENIRKDYLFDNSLWILLNSKNAKIGEEKSPVRYQGEVSDVKYFKFIKASISYFIYAYFWRINNKYGLFNPIYLFFLFSLLSLLYFFYTRNLMYMVSCLAFFLWSIFYDYWNDPNYAHFRKKK